jgi:uncharacterized spore protein YtfJ
MTTSDAERADARFRPAGVADLVDQAKGIMSAERVFSTPVERDGTTVITAAAVRGGGGGGGGGGENARGEEGTGEGLGFGMSARPVGAYVIRDGEVAWRPAVDVTRIAIAADLVVVVLFLVRWLVKRTEGRTQVKVARAGR